jgi:hypothetical protein
MQIVRNCACAESHFYAINFFFRKKVANQEQYIYEARRLHNQRHEGCGQLRTPSPPALSWEIIPIIIEQEIGWTPDPVSMCV